MTTLHEAAQQGEPVAWIKFLSGANAKPNGQCYDIVFAPCDGYQPLYAGAAPAAQPDLSALSPKAQELVREWIADGTFVERAIGVISEQERELMAYEKAAPAAQLLTQTQVVEGFCSLPHDVQYVSVFEKGVRFAEQHHGIGVQK